MQLRIIRNNSYRNDEILLRMIINCKNQLHTFICVSINLFCTYANKSIATICFLVYCSMRNEKLGIEVMNRAARRNAKKKRKAFDKAMEQKQPSNDSYNNVKEIHDGVPFWEVYPITVTPRLFLGSSAAHRQFTSVAEPHYENY